MSRNRECENPRDRYYALRGVFERLHGGQAIRSAVDYKKDVDKVFTEVTKDALLDKTSSFFGLAQTHQECHREERLNAPSWVQRLPSWVPDWTFEANVGSFVPRYYAAGGPSRLQIDTTMFSPGQDCLSIQGFTFSKVSSCFHRDCDDSWVPADFDELEEWALCSTRLRYQSNLHVAEALARTLVHDLMSLKENASVHSVSKRWPRDDLLLAYRPWHSPLEIQKRAESLCSKLDENGITLEAATECNSKYRENLPGSVRGHRVAVLDDGSLALCPSSTMKGDMMVVFPGVEMPFVLRQRPRDDRYQMVGPAFVDGIMDGELMDAVQEGKYQLQTIVMD